MKTKTKSTTAAGRKNVRDRLRLSSTYGLGPAGPIGPAGPVGPTGPTNGESSIGSTGTCSNGPVGDDSILRRYVPSPNAKVHVIDVLEEMNFNVGNAVMFSWGVGAGSSTRPLHDLKLARWYLDREIARLSKE